MMHLVRLIENEDYEKVKELIIKNGLPTDSEWSDYLLLRFVVCKGHLDTTKFLIEQGCRVNKNVKAPLNTLLHIAVKGKYLEIVKLLLENGASTDRKNDAGETPLTLAARSKNEEIIELILNEVNNVENENTVNQCLEDFHIACIKNQLDVVEELIRLGASINKPVSVESSFWPDCTPLHLAVDCGHYEIVETLLHSGADLSPKNSRGKTALHLAVDQNNDRIVKLILNTIDARSIYENSTEDNGFSHFHVACMKEEPKIAEGFLTHGVDVNSRISENSDFWPGYTPLHFAVHYNCNLVVKLLLDNGAHLNLKNKKGLTPLHLAVRDLKVEIIEMIASSQMESSRIVNKTYDCGFSHVHAMCLINNWNVVLGFLSQGEDVNQTVKADSPMWALYTPLHFALIYKSEMTAKLLLKHGADINSTLDTTALHLAAEHVGASIVRTLLKNGANANAFNQAGMTALHVATKCRKQSVISKLIKYNADINCAEKHSEATPLHLAVEYNVFEIVKFLLAQGADHSRKNKKGQTPLHIAVQQMNKQLIDLILSSISCSSTFTNQVDDFGFSYLHAACITNKCELVLTLLQKGEDVNQTVKASSPAWSMCTPLYFAMMNNCESTVKLLLRHGAIVNPASGMTALHMAVQFMNRHIVNMLLVDGADVNTGTRSGMSPLHMAVERGDRKMVQQLIKYNADVNWVEKYERRTPLHFAARSGEIEIVETLLREGADVNATTAINGLTALHLMTHPTAKKVFDQNMADIYSKIIRDIVEAGCDINVKDVFGFTPLYYASIYKCCSSVYALLRNGADQNVKDRSGEVLVSSYIKSGSPELKKIFHHYTVKLRILDLSVKNMEPKFEDTEDPFVRRCVDELNRMRAIRIDHYSSLYSMIFMDPTAMASHLLNESFRRMLQSREFDKSFPLYGYLVRQRFRKGSIVATYLNPAKDALAILSRMDLPDYCCESVINYLSVQDLKNLISATDR